MTETEKYMACIMVHSYCPRLRPKQIPIAGAQNPMGICVVIYVQYEQLHTILYKPFFICIDVGQSKHTAKLYRSVHTDRDSLTIEFPGIGICLWVGLGKRE